MGQKRDKEVWRMRHTHFGSRRSSSPPEMQHCETAMRNLALKVFPIPVLFVSCLFVSFYHFFGFIFLIYSILRSTSVPSSPSIDPGSQVDISVGYVCARIIPDIN